MQSQNPPDFMNLNPETKSNEIVEEESSEEEYENKKDSVQEFLDAY